MSVKLHTIYPQMGLSPLLFCVDVTSGNPEEQKETPVMPKPAVLPDEPQEDVQINPNIRHCILERGSAGFDFNLGCVQQKPGTFISQVQWSPFTAKSVFRRYWLQRLGLNRNVPDSLIGGDSSQNYTLGKSALGHKVNCIQPNIKGVIF